MVCRGSHAATLSVDGVAAGPCQLQGPVLSEHMLQAVRCNAHGQLQSAYDTRPLLVAGLQPVVVQD